MTTQATGRFEVTSWEETTYGETDEGLRLTRVTAMQSYQGDIRGEGAVEYVMVYTDEHTATFVGMELVMGSIGHRQGSWVCQHTGTDNGGTVRSTWSVVPGSATGELRGLRGESHFTAAHSMQVDYTFEYRFE